MLPVFEFYVNSITQNLLLFWSSSFIQHDVFEINPFFMLQ